MLVKTPAIVLSTLKYSEADLIARLYTKELGTQSFILKGIRKTRKGKLRISFFQPLTQLVIETNYKGKGSLEYIKEAQVIHPYVYIHTSIVKSSITMFFSEVLSQILTEQQPDEELFEYLSSVFQYLDQAEEVANFSIKMLIDMSMFLGFQPDTSTMEKPYFNLLNGNFDDNGLQPHHLSITESNLLKQFLGTDFDQINQIKMHREERNALLNLVIDYFQIHLQIFKKPHSLSILKQLFDK
ncbi:DNA replication and repair protein RecO [Nonlabens dokdonensis]|uniref:DNA repair protein RecO n=2 Tax=Nonlabens dokdonensis TaxID=328515 RepID=L7W8B6_NONDD|nr:DNA repair protein RecO [Nonlabens dokdonensis]AGC76046.1 putative DNA repair protein [Nonlabens dokdonensis DSW-6]PZX43718.1 DNA replication and repair protein RecO [Nonlabens dokdonensis]